MPILLGDDGTMDTVVFCSECGREYRGNWDPNPDTAECGDETYDDFIDWFIGEIEVEHVCGEDDL